MITITHRALPQPEMSWRRNKSPHTTMRSQNHTTKMNTARTSVKKFEKLNPPSNSMAILPPPLPTNEALVRPNRRSLAAMAPGQHASKGRAEQKHGENGDEQQRHRRP